MATSSAIYDESSPEYRKAYKHYLKSSNTAPTTTWSPFRIEEKFYKSRFPRPTLANVIDLNHTEDNIEDETLQRVGWSKGTCDAETVQSIRTTDGSNAFRIKSIPGLVVLPGFLSHSQQRDLITSSLREQSRHPNETNLDAHYDIPDDGLWRHWERLHRSGSSSSASEDTIIHPKIPTSSPQGIPDASVPVPESKRTLIENVAASVGLLPTLLSTPKPAPPPSSSLQPSPVSKLLYKMRWANLGRSYHWGTKSYDFEKTLAPFPKDVRDICQRAVRAVEWEDVWGGRAEANGDEADSGREIPDEEWGEEGAQSWKTWADDYEPDAGIVNFYQQSDTLMGHVDRSELSSTTPLVSISLGNAAIFLIGGLTRDTKPLAILLRSGDVVIMSGPRCRRAYHGVPRILEGTLPPHLQSDKSHPRSESDPVARDGITSALSTVNDDEWKPFAAYMATTRINVNVRQVFPKGFVPPTGVSK
ncbi:hypothetical protein DL93DRAFT_2162389 [Clavulina sp. PMI_390]|nr:hypothetical protein DL93DRAFT_2162389 [Clavulina sp. PMI_390]